MQLLAVKDQKNFPKDSVDIKKGFCFMVEEVNEGSRPQAKLRLVNVTREP